MDVDDVDNDVDEDVDDVEVDDDMLMLILRCMLIRGWFQSDMTIDLWDLIYRPISSPRGTM